MFKQRKNKRFSYKTRFQDSSPDYNREELKDDFETKWKESKGGNNSKRNVFRSLPTLILVLVSLVFLIYILEGYSK